MSDVMIAETVEISPLDPSTWKDRTGLIESKGLRFQVDVLDGRIRFGHFDLLVRPRSGIGETWVEHHNVTILGPAGGAVAVAR